MSNMLYNREDIILKQNNHKKVKSSNKMKMRIAAVKRKWLKTESPFIEDWNYIIYEICVMERITFYARLLGPH